MSKQKVSFKKRAEAGTSRTSGGALQLQTAKLVSVKSSVVPAPRDLSGLPAKIEAVVMLPAEEVRAPYRPAKQPRSLASSLLIALAKVPLIWNGRQTTVGGDL